MPLLININLHLWIEGSRHQCPKCAGRDSSAWRSVERLRASDDEFDRLRRWCTWSIARYIYITLQCSALINPHRSIYATTRVKHHSTGQRVTGTSKWSVCCSRPTATRTSRAVRHSNRASIRQCARAAICCANKRNNSDTRSMSRVILISPCKNGSVLHLLFTCDNILTPS